MLVHNAGGFWGPLHREAQTNGGKLFAPEDLFVIAATGYVSLDPTLLRPIHYFLPKTTLRTNDSIWNFVFSNHWAANSNILSGKIKPISQGLPRNKKNLKTLGAQNTVVSAFYKNREEGEIIHPTFLTTLSCSLEMVTEFFASNSHTLEMTSLPGKVTEVNGLWGPQSRLRSRHKGHFRHHFQIHQCWDLGRGADVDKIKTINWKRKHVLTSGNEILILWNAPRIPQTWPGMSSPQSHRSIHGKCFNLFENKETQFSVCPNNDK